MAASESSRDFRSHVPMMAWPVAAARTATIMTLSESMAWSSGPTHVCENVQAALCSMAQAHTASAQHETGKTQNTRKAIEISILWYLRTANCCSGGVCFPVSAHLSFGAVALEKNSEYYNHKHP